MLRLDHSPTAGERTARPGGRFGGLDQRCRCDQVHRRVQATQFVKRYFGHRNPVDLGFRIGEQLKNVERPLPHRAPE